MTDRYKVIQNQEAFAFTDELLGEGVRYETAGSLQGGRRIWLLAHMLHEYIIYGERISPYLIFSNTHDGSGAIKAALTPIRVVCQNTLNLALPNAKRSWSMIHTGNIQNKLEEARDTLFMAENYMDSLGKEFERLRAITMPDKKVMEYMELLLPVEENATPQQKKNIRRLQEDMKISGELKLFKFRILKMKKKDIFQAAYQIDTIICIYELLIETSTCMSEEALQAGISFPGILMFLYERWLSYEDVHMENLMCCLNEELAKILKHYGEKKSKEKGNAA